MNIATELLPKRRVDGRCGLAVVRMKHVGIDRKRDAWPGMAQAFADGDDINIAGDQLRGVGMPKGVKRDVGYADALGEVAPVG